MKITILDILDINDKTSSFEIYFVLEAFWYDSDLTYTYLKDNYVGNMINSWLRDEIWTPNIQFIHKKSIDILEEKMFIAKNISSLPFVNEKSKIRMVEYYRGSENAIVYQMKITSSFSCSFRQIVHYPFGTEECQMRFYLTGRSNAVTTIYPKLVVSKMSSRVVQQFGVLNWTMGKETDPETDERMVTVTGDKYVIDHSIFSS